MSIEMVILVDENDQEIGLMEKQEAHEKALLHRAFSVLIFNQFGETLLQQRAFSKYHSAGLWTNACCSHPRAGESTIEAAKRRLNEELGFSCDLHLKHSFIYKAPFDNGLTEHEFDHVYFGNYQGQMQLNPDEVAAVKWVSIDWLKQDVLVNPAHYTVWFRMILEKIHL
jgi:isopentenyl-diphosphate Delta-isomerase